MDIQGFENQLIEAMYQIKRNNDNLQQSLDKKCDIILLVGDIGSGKSTVFNLLCGARLEIRQEYGIDVVGVKDGTRHYSIIKHKINSQTFQPIYYYSEQNNHILIDFPGFRENRGEIEDLVIQLLFHKILTKYNVKLIYLIQQPSVQMLNRGIELQSFIKIFYDNQVCFSECLLIFNQFIDDKYNDEIAIQLIQQQLMTITNDVKHANTFIIRRLNQFNVEQIPLINQNLWNYIKNLNSIRFYNLKIENLQIVDKYLENKSQLFFQEINQIFKIQVKRSIKNLFQEQITSIKNILEHFQSHSLQSTIYLEKLYLILQELQLLFNSKTSESQSNFQGFIRISQFFQDYGESIQFFQNCNVYLMKIDIKMRLLQKLLDQQLEANVRQEQSLQPNQQQFQELNNLLDKIKKQYQQDYSQDVKQNKLNSNSGQSIQNMELSEKDQIQQQVQFYSTQLLQDNNTKLDNIFYFAKILIPLIDKKVT